MRWNNTLLAIWLKWRSANLFLNICFVNFWMNPKVVPIWFKWREINFLIFFSFLCGEKIRCWLSDWSAGQQTGFLTLFCKILNKCKSCSYLIQVEGNDFLLFLVLMRWNNTLLAIWLKWRSANLFPNICFVKIWMNAKAVPIWFKRREMTFFSRSYAVKQYAAGHLIEVELSKLVS